MMRTKTSNTNQRRQGSGRSAEAEMNRQTEGGSDVRVTKRRRKPSKPKDKKYECPEEGCGKSYSRAEHLYRHQLNHAPKQIYHCDFEGCDRHFVRQDLCTRHRERHTKENSHLYRKDAFKHKKHAIQSPISSSGPSDIQELPAVPSTISDHSPALQEPKQVSDQKPMVSSLNFGSMALDPRLAAGSPNFPSPHQASAFSGTTLNVHHERGPINLNSMSEQMNRHSGLPLGFVGAPQGASVNLENTDSIQNSMSPINNSVNSATFARPSMPHTQPMNLYQLSPAHNLFSPLHIGSIPHLPHPYMSPSPSTNLKSPPTMANMPNPSSFALPIGSQMSPTVGVRSDSVTSYMSKSLLAEPPTTSHVQNASYSTAPIVNHMPTGMTVPVFNESYGPSPFEMPETEFISWLFENDQNAVCSPLRQAHLNQYNPHPHILNHDMHSPGRAVHLEPLLLTSTIPKSTLSSVRPESMMSDPRRHQLLNLILNDFKDERHIHVTKQREDALNGDRDQDSHVLSLRMMQMYISSFWLHVHPQLPILHKPTFSAETCPDLLLIAIMVLGASCLEESYGYETTQACAGLSFFLAWHTRRMIFEDPDFLPPAKLWVFQALLLLEVFEKMFSTTSLHQRAHVHHSTTLTLMRRGSSLIGRSALDFPPYAKDPTRTPPGPNGSINTAGRNTNDEWWNSWISNEATRRTAFAAFIIDTTHAAMFGHSAVMVAHEMRIPLPCDEALWSATDGSEVRRHEQSLALNGMRPISFLEALKKTLNSQNVPTNTFGRVIVMAGLLSVSWHMRMQDVRVTSIGVGKQGSWSEHLEHAFDFWKHDFDTTLAKSSNIHLQERNLADAEDKDKVFASRIFESRTVLHHLAHMAMHVDIIDCQILAGAKRTLGRVITTKDHAAASKRMKEIWAPSRGARDAAFYALRFLSEVLLPEDDGSFGPRPTPLRLAYSVRDDNLLNRPWVLYFATLVVWAYGYCMDGPMTPTYTLTTHELKFQDMQIFLRRVGRVRSADDLQHVKHRNGCLGLLMLLKDLFNTTRWELLHEAREILGNCIELLMPGMPNP